VKKTMPANATSTAGAAASGQDITDPSLIHKLQGLRDGVHDVTFHPQSQQVAAACNDGSILIWDLQHPNVRAYKFCGHNEAVTSVCFSNSGELLASCSRDRMVRLWESGVEGRSVEFKAHTSAIRSIHFSPGDSDRLITASDDKSVKMWTTQGHKFLRSFVTHKGAVRCAKFSPTGELVASVSDDKTIRLFDADSDREIHVFNEVKGQAVHLDWHPGGTCLGVATSDKKVKVYDVRMLKLQQLYGAHDGPVSQVSFHPNGNYMASGSEDGSLKIYDLLEARPIYDLLGHKGSVTSVKFSARGDYFASGESEKLVFVWKTNFDVEDQQIQQQAEQQAAAHAKPQHTGGSTKKHQLDQANKPLKSGNCPTTPATGGSREKVGGGGNATTPLSSAVGKTSLRENKENDCSSGVSESVAAKLSAQLNQMNAKMETLTQTLLMMEKRLSLVEEQLQLSASSVHSAAADNSC